MARAINIGFCSFLVNKARSEKSYIDLKKQVKILIFIKKNF